MILKNYRSKKILYLTIVLVGLILNVLIYDLEGNNNSTINEKKDNNSSFFQDSLLKTQDTVQNTITKEWLNNTDFSSGIDPWYNTTEGDSTDVNATYSDGTANYEVLGNSGKFELIVDPTNSTEMAKWTAVRESQYVIFPDFHTKTEEGFFASHSWNEGDSGGQDNNSCAVRWVRNVEMGFNMSDYEITSASITAEFNATVEADSDGTPNSDSYGGIEVPGDVTYPGQDDTWDFAYFSVEVSSEDLPDMKTLLAYNRTNQLGDDNLPLSDNDYDYLGDTEMILNLDQNLLISTLESALSIDDFNFTIYLGIDIFCADNWYGTDIDNFNELIIRSLNLTFTYVKKIDQLTSLSWNQIGDMINHTSEQYYSNTRIDNAQLNFKYKINQTWPSESINSEIRFLINDVSQTDYPYTKLRSYNHTELLGEFIEVKSGGYDITDYIPIEKNITLTIQILMLDNFNLDRVINISIDDVYFVISYTVFYDFPPIITSGGGGSSKTKTTFIEEPWINLLIAIAAIAGAICLGGYLVAYQLVLKYPKPVRKVRKFRKTLKRKTGPSIAITSRKSAFNEIYTTKISKVKNFFGSATSQKIAAKDKLVQKSLSLSSEKLIKKLPKKSKPKGEHTPNK